MTPAEKSLMQTERLKIDGHESGSEMSGLRISGTHNKVPLFCVAQVVAQFAEGFALSKDADSTT